MRKGLDSWTNWILLQLQKFIIHFFFKIRMNQQLQLFLKCKCLFHFCLHSPY